MSSLVKFRVRFTDNVKRDEFEVMRSLNSVTPLNILDAFVGNDFAIITLSNNKELEKLLTSESITKLKEMHLNIIPPASLKSEKSVFIPKVRDFLSNTKPEDLVMQINKCNANKIKATDVVVVTGNNFVHGMKKNLKISFETTDQADFAFSNGFNIGDFHISSNQIQREEFIQLRQCFKCFKYDHFANKCKKTPKCSICSEEHSFKLCPVKEDNDKFKCAACGGPHLAIAASCPIRKAEIKKMKDERKAQTIPPPPPLQPQPQPLNPAHFPNLPSTSPAQYLHPTPAQLPAHPPQPTPAQPPHLPPVQPSATPTHPPAQTPAQPSAPHSPSNIHPFLPVYIEIWKAIAEKLAGNDMLKYIQVFNAFLETNSCPSFKTPDLVKDLY